MGGQYIKIYMYSVGSFLTCPRLLYILERAGQNKQLAYNEEYSSIFIWIVAMKQATDLCHTCQQNANLVIKVANMPVS